MKKVMVMGTFDLLHKGHINFLRQAKKHGDSLTVLVARDETVKRIKGHLPAWSAKERAAALTKTCIANKVIIGRAGDKYAALEKERPDIICLGYDQTTYTDRLAAEMKKRGLRLRIIRLKAYRPSIYKTSKMKLSTP